MPESTNEINSIRDKKQDAIEKGEVAITSHDYVEEAEQEYNSASDSVFRVDELLTVKNDHPVIRKLNRLKNVGLTDEMILDTYNDLAGNVTTETAAMDVLKIIFDRYVTYFSELPNGIVLDPLSGRIDFEASYEQRLELGILTDPFEGLDLTKSISIDDILNLDRSELEKGFKDYVVEIQELMMNSQSLKNWFNNIENKDEFDVFVEMDSDEMVFSDTVKDFVDDIQEQLIESDYEANVGLFEITQLELKVREFKGTHAGFVYAQKRDEFYEKHPEYVGNVKIINPDGDVDKAELDEFEKYKENYKILFILSKIDKYKRMSPEETQNMSTEERKLFFTTITSALQYFRKTDPALQEMVSDAQAILQERYPDLDFSRKKTKEQRKLFAKLAKEELGVNFPDEELSFTSMYVFANQQVSDIMEEYLINDKTPILQQTFDDVSMDMINEDSKKKALKDYFIGSKIKFAREQADSYDDLYDYLTVFSWIEDKDTALKLRYGALIALQEQYSEKRDNPYVAERLEKINAQIKEFEDKHGNLGIDDEDSRRKCIIDFEIYKDNMVNSNIMKYYLKDALEAQKGNTYTDLDDEHKKAYMRNTLLGLKYIEYNPGFCATQMVMRRLEVMNTKYKNFISFDKDGNPTIDKELLLQEYSELSDHKYESFEELLEAAELRKDDFVLDKLEEYSELEEEQFVKLEDRDNTEMSIKQIEIARADKIQQEKRTQKKVLKRISNGPNIVTRADKVVHKPNNIRPYAKVAISDREAEKAIERMQEEMDTSGVEELKRRVHLSRNISAFENRSNSQVELKNDRADMKTQSGNEMKPKNRAEETLKDVLEDGETSSSSDGNVEAVVMDSSAVTNALVPIEETNKLKKFGAMLTNILSSIKNKLVLKKKEEPEHDEVRKDAVSVLKDSKGNDFKNQGPIVTYEQQKENAMKMQGTQITQTPQKNQVKNIDTQSDYEGPSI